MVFLCDDTELRREMGRRTSGEPLAWLDVGERELSLFGSPTALRRVGSELMQLAEDAELADAGESESEAAA
jgi:hypothetical protein